MEITLNTNSYSHISVGSIRVAKTETTLIYFGEIFLKQDSSLDVTISIPYISVEQCWTLIGGMIFLNLIYGGFIALGGTDNLFKTNLSDFTERI